MQTSIRREMQEARDEEVQQAFQFYSGFSSLSDSSDREAKAIRARAVARIEEKWNHRTKETESLTAKAGQFLKAIGDPPKRFELSGSDWHSGTQTIFVQTEGNSRYVLKRADPQLLEITNRWLGQLVGQTQEYFSIGNGVQKLILRKYISPSSETNAPRDHYKKYGMVLAFAYFFNAADLHCENIVVSRWSPVPIDIECLFYSFENLCTALSFDSTGVVEQPNGRGSRFKGLSAIFGGGQLTQHGKLVRNNDGKIVARVPVEIVSNFVSNEQNVRYPPREFVVDIISGFETAIDYYIKRLPEIKEEILCYAELESRILISPTILYMNIEAESRFLDEALARKAILFRLRNRKFATDGVIQQREMEAILKGNIPFFSVKVMNGLLHSSVGRKPIRIAAPIRQFLKKAEYIKSRGTSRMTQRLRAYLNDA